MADNVVLYEVDFGPDYLKAAKRFVKKKKFVHLPKQVDELISELEMGSFSGTCT